MVVLEFAAVFVTVYMETRMKELVRYMYLYRIITMYAQHSVKYNSVICLMLND